MCDTDSIETALISLIAVRGIGPSLFWISNICCPLFDIVHLPIPALDHHFSDVITSEVSIHDLEVLLGHRAMWSICHPTGTPSARAIRTTAATITAEFESNSGFLSRICPRRPNCCSVSLIAMRRVLCVPLVGIMYPYSQTGIYLYGYGKTMSQCSNERVNYELITMNPCS